MRKAPIVFLAICLPFAGLGTSIFWDTGSLSHQGSSWDGTKESYFWSLYMGDWDGGGEAAYMSIGFHVANQDGLLTISAGDMDLAFGKWAKRCSSDDLITIDTVKQGYFQTNTGEGDNHDSSFLISKNGRCTFGYAVESYGDENGVGAGEWVYGWVTFIFSDGIPYPSSGCYVFGADGIYARSSAYIPRTLQPAQTPEPGTFSLFLVGIVGLMLKRRCRP
jgi:hypothetical protein